MLAILSFLLVIFQMFEHVVTEDKPKCGNMVVPMCTNIFGGNTTYQTSVPTQRQKELEKELLSHFIPLMHIKCSRFTLLFVCRSHLPFCSLSHTHLPPPMPCHPVCHHVYHHCIHLVFPGHSTSTALNFLFILIFASSCHHHPFSNQQQRLLEMSQVYFIQASIQRSLPPRHRSS